MQPSSQVLLAQIYTVAIQYQLWPPLKIQTQYLLQKKSSTFVSDVSNSYCLASLSKEFLQNSGLSSPNLSETWQIRNNMNVSFFTDTVSESTFSAFSGTDLTILNLQHFCLQHITYSYFPIRFHPVQIFKPRVYYCRHVQDSLLVVLLVPLQKNNSQTLFRFLNESGFFPLRCKVTSRKSFKYWCKKACCCIFL